MAAGLGGVGIAATQVGVMQRIVIVNVSTYPKIKKAKHHGHIILVNPEIIDWQGMKKGREGCMSVPDFTGNVIRAESIVLHALNEKGIQQEYEMEGFEARAVQHEIDHLDGLLFLDRLVSRRNDLFKRKNYK
jgi:peptide deformylase